MSARLGQVLAVRDSRADAMVALAEAVRARRSPSLERPCSLLWADDNLRVFLVQLSIGFPPAQASALAKVQKMAPNPLESFSRRPILPAAGIARPGTASGSSTATSDTNPAR